MMSEISSGKNHVDKSQSQRTLPNEEYHKIAFSLVEHAYSQLNVSIIASLGCGIIVFTILYDTKKNTQLMLWGGLFLVIQGFRLVSYLLFRQKKNLRMQTTLWGNLYGLGCFLSGVVWGASGIIFFPVASQLQQTLMILIMAGVTAGSIPLAATIPKAGLAFLLTSIPCYMISIILFKYSAYYFFDVALIIYLGYAIVLTYRTYHLVRNIFILKYENDILLDDLEISNRMLELAATHDPLTNIPNRRLFQANLDVSIARASANRSSFVLFYIDLDHFKDANDSYGHEAGDFVLKSVAYTLNMHFRNEEVVARLGGDELAVIIEGLKKTEDIEAIARKICQIVAAPIKMRDIILKVTASVGVSLYPEDGATGDELITCADHRMYAVKQQGGDNFLFRKSGRVAVVE